MNVGSTFSGVGGFDLGFERAGMRVVWQAEIDEWCCRVLRDHWPGATIYDDVRTVGRSAAPVDLLCGGFPCQDLSVAGKRAGFKGERSSLFFEFARIADELRPRWIVLENVVGLLSSTNGRDFGILLATLAEIGYIDLCWRVVNARFFGVPQRRRRVFIVGYLGDNCGRAVRALGAGGEGNLAAGECSWQDVAARVTSSVRNASGLITEPTAKCLTTSNQRIDAETESFVVRPAATGFHRTQTPITEHEGSPALGVTSGGMGVIANALDRGQGGADDNSAQANHIVPDGSSVRRLTPVECERLMGWPDNWTAVDGDKTPDGRRYAACGNGVVANVSEWIGRRIMAIDRLDNK